MSQLCKTLPPNLVQHLFNIVNTDSFFDTKFPLITVDFGNLVTVLTLKTFSLFSKTSNKLRNFTQLKSKCIYCFISNSSKVKYL